MKSNFRFTLLLAVFGMLVFLSSPAVLWGQCELPAKCDGDGDGYLKDTKKCLKDYGDACPIDCDDSNYDPDNVCTEPGQDPFYYYRAWLEEERDSDGSRLSNYYEIQHDSYQEFGDYVDGIDKVGIASTTNAGATGTFSFNTYGGKLKPPGNKVAVRNVWMDLTDFADEYMEYFGDGEFLPSWTIPDGVGYSGLISIGMRTGGLDLDTLCVEGEEGCDDSCYMGRLGDCLSGESSPYGLVELQINFPVEGDNPNDRARLVYCNPDPDMLQYAECTGEDSWTVVTRIGQNQWEIKGITATLGVLIPDLEGHPASFVMTIERLP